MSRDGGDRPWQLRTPLVCPIRRPRFTAASWPTVWSRYAGSGLSFNNNYAGLALGLSGTAYLGVIGGFVALRDGG